MTENSDNELIKKRQEIKAEIKRGKYKSLGRVMLDETGRLIQKVIFSKKPSAFWLNSIVFALLTLLICTLVVYPPRQVSKPSGLVAALLSYRSDMKFI